MSALAKAMRAAIEAAGIDGEQIQAIALDTTGSSVIPVDEHLNPLDDYYLWCDHRAWSEAAEITAGRARPASSPPSIGAAASTPPNGAGPSCCTGCATTPTSATRFATALEHCDMVAAVLCGITDPARVPRSICAMGHKWMWSAALGGLPPEEFLTSVDPLLAGVRAKIAGRLRDFGPDSGPSLASMGRESSDCAPASRFPSARSTRTGTQSAPAYVWAT